MDTPSVTRQYLTLAILFGGALGIILFLAFNAHTKNVPASTATAENALVQTPAAPLAQVSLAFVGDIMVDRGVETSVKKHFGGDYAKLFEKMSVLKDADITFANLEGPVTDTGSNAGSKFSFMFPPVITNVLANAGFDVVSIANNHAGDRSLAGFTNTLLHVQESNILPIGGGVNHADAVLPKIIEKNGMKIGFLAFTDVGPNWLAATDTTPGIVLASDPDFDAIIKNASQKVDALVVSFHWGEEYLYNAHTARQETLAHQAINDGAKLVIGHHPHVAEDVEEYNTGLIVYSLGNFIFDQYFSPHTMEGMAAFITLKKDGAIVRNFKTVKLNSFYQPEELIESTITGATALPAVATGYPNEEAPVKKEQPPVKEKVLCEKGSGSDTDLALLNVGPSTALPDPSYVPDDLVALDTKITGGEIFCLRKEAAGQITAMINDAKDEGVVITVSSAFRDYKTQKSILDHWISVSGAQAYRRVAKPGYSEHQLGTTVDVSGKSINFSSAADIFGTSPEALWLEENAETYGFVRSYPEGKEDITGYAYEPWHYRYVGTEYAQTIKQKGKTINQFLTDLISTINIGG